MEPIAAGSPAARRPPRARGVCLALAAQRLFESEVVFEKLVEGSVDVASGTPDALRRIRLSDRRPAPLCRAGGPFVPESRDKTCAPDETGEIAKGHARRLLILDEATPNWMCPTTLLRAA
ncbi:hypothetical protein [Actinoplanes sp. NPDC051859]|uniref:hypothetical protein n=1 Tax=Actinoplanes sp. NPDC051859 TaxID=3363909 RepID=UPI00379FCDA3